MKDYKNGKIPSYDECIKNDYSNSLHSKEKDYISKFVTPPQHPITIEMLNQNLNYEFGEKNRKRQI